LRWEWSDHTPYYLTEAIAMFQEMDMDWDLARAEQMLTS
jgi:hypothetical protein